MRRAGLAVVPIVVAWVLTACGGSTTTTVHSGSAGATTTTSAPATASTPTAATTSATTTTPIAQDTNPNKPDYWAPEYENGLVSSCVSNKIAPTEKMCNCIVALLQSHHPALAEQANARDVVQWMRTASGNPFGLRDYALRCGQG